MSNRRFYLQAWTIIGAGFVALSGCASRSPVQPVSAVPADRLTEIAIPVEGSLASACRVKPEPVAVARPVAPLTELDTAGVEADLASEVQLVAHTNDELPQPTLADDLPVVDADHDVIVPPHVGGRTVEQAEAAAVSWNPGLAAATASVQKATGIWCQVGLKPNPIVGYQANEIGADGRAGQQGVYWQQTFVRGDKLRLNREVEAWEIEKLKWEAEVLRTRIVTDVHVQFAATLAAQMKLRLSEELVASADQMVELSQRLFAASEVAEADVLQARVQAAEIAVLADNASADAMAEWRKLALLTGWNASESEPLEGSLDSLDLTVDFEATYQDLLARSPEIRAAETRVNAARKQVERQQVQAIPNIEMQSGLGYDYGGNGTIVNLQFGLPLPIHNDNRGNTSAAWSSYQQACGELQRLKLALRNRLADEFRNYERSVRQTRRYRETILPVAERSLELSVKGYEVGEYSVLRTVQARQAYSQAKLSSIDSAAGVRMAEARIHGLLLDNSWESTLPQASGDNLQGVGLRDQSLGGE